MLWPSLRRTLVSVLLFWQFGRGVSTKPRSVAAGKEVPAHSMIQNILRRVVVCELWQRHEDLSDPIRSQISRDYVRMHTRYDYADSGSLRAGATRSRREGDQLQNASDHSVAAGSVLHCCPAGPSCGLRTAHANPIPYVHEYVGLSQIVETGFPEVRNHACAPWSNFMMTYRGFPQPNQWNHRGPQGISYPNLSGRSARIARSLPRIRCAHAHTHTYIHTTYYTRLQIACLTPSPTFSFLRFKSDDSDPNISKAKTTTCSYFCLGLLSITSFYSSARFCW